MKMNTSDGGAKGGGLPGVKKTKPMNAYAKGGMVAPSQSSGSMSKGTVRGGGAATKGLSFES